MALVVGINSYASRAYADAYLAASTRAADNWSVLGATEKENALITAFRMIERSTFQGDRTPVTRITAGTVSAGGSGYSVGDVLTLAGGTGRAATFEILTISTGAAATIKLLDAGDYTTAPASPASVTSSPGSAATIAITTATQTSRWPRSNVTDAEGDTVDEDTVPDQILQAQCELAYELTQDASIETARDQNSNIASVNAGGGVGVTFFRPQDQNGRFPPTVQELLREFLGLAAGASAASESIALGSECESSFSRCKFGLSEGTP